MADENNNTGAAPQQDAGEAPKTEAPKVEAAANAAAGLLTTLKNNPKALYALIGAVAVISLAIALGGGGGGVEVKTALSTGQAVLLQNPNGGETQLNVMPALVSVAVTEEDEKQIVCRVPAGTGAVVLEEQVVANLPFVKVKVTDGPCQGQSGWASKVNLQGK